MKRLIPYAALILFIGILAPQSSAQIGEILRRANSHAQKAKQAAAIYTDWTPEQEEAIGRASAAKLINIFGLYENPDMVKYVNLVGNAVARQGTRSVPYRFGILDTEIITAVSLPGGYVFITRGALANIQNEAELAGVLAHEVAHVDRRHLEKEIRARKTSQFAKEEAASRIPRDAELIGIAGDVVKNALTMQVSRDKETEADKLGLEMAAKAGYDPAGLRNFLQLLAQASKDPQSQRRLGLWGSTHPPLQERIATLDSLLPNYPSNGQELAERYNWYVNPVSFSKSAASAASAPAASSASSSGTKEYDGVMSGGVIVLQNGRIAEGTRVKVRVVQ